MARPKRSEQHADLQEAIKQSAWEQIAQIGAPSLSLRAIARQLGITAPAIYNYFPRRDDLVTALIVDAFNSLADAEEAAIFILPTDDYADRLAALGWAYRHWALSYPERYSLIFGTPISGYDAPGEITLPAAARALEVVMQVMEGARKAGRLKILPEYVNLSPELLTELEEWRMMHPEIDAHVLHFSLVVWGVVHGLVSLEIYRQFPPMLRHTDEIFEIEVQALIGKLFQV